MNVSAKGSIRVRIPLEDFTGKTVYHCHIRDHEDAGMMGIISATQQQLLVTDCDVPLSGVISLHRVGSVVLA